MSSSSSPSSTPPSDLNNTNNLPFKSDSKSGSDGSNLRRRGVEEENQGKALFPSEYFVEMNSGDVNFDTDETFDVKNGGDFDNPSKCLSDSLGSDPRGSMGLRLKSEVGVVSDSLTENQMSFNDKEAMVARKKSGLLGMNSKKASSEEMINVGGLKSEGGLMNPIGGFGFGSGNDKRGSTCLSNPCENEWKESDHDPASIANVGDQARSRFAQSGKVDGLEGLEVEPKDDAGEHNLVIADSTAGDQSVIAGKRKSEEQTGLDQNSPCIHSGLINLVAVEHAKEVEKTNQTKRARSVRMRSIMRGHGAIGSASRFARPRRDEERRQFCDLVNIVNKRHSTTAFNWVAAKDPARNLVYPSLLDLCLKTLSNNPEAITSLEGIPDEQKPKLIRMLCDTRKMDSRLLDLILSEGPDALRLTDCSWMTEEMMIEAFGDRDTSMLRVLELDLCGSCVTTNALRATLARRPFTVPSLVVLSLKGASRVTDDGIRYLLAATPSLRSINLSHCSLITTVSINAIGERLGWLFKELYLDNCQRIHPMLLLLELKKFTALEVLSLSEMQSVCDSFVSSFPSSQCCPNLKELSLANCQKITNCSVRAIAKFFRGMCALDLTNLPNLTDVSIDYITTSSPSLQMLKVGGNSFTDEAVAAYLEGSGKLLTELSLNGIRNVGPRTTFSLAKNCTKNLVSLDLSWCPELTDDAVGYMVDRCLSLKVLKLFGCTQITKAFVNGHSNPNVRIIGLPQGPTLEGVDLLDTQKGVLKYSKEFE